jgi:hypothetical protein
VELVLLVVTLYSAPLHLLVAVAVLHIAQAQVRVVVQVVALLQMFHLVVLEILLPYLHHKVTMVAVTQVVTLVQVVVVRALRVQASVLLLVVMAALEHLIQFQVHR